MCVHACVCVCLGEGMADPFYLASKTLGRMLSVHVFPLNGVVLLTLSVHVCSTQLDQQRQAPPGEPTRDYVESLVDREKNMKEHRAPLPAYQDPPAYPEGRPLPETPEYANTSAVFTASPYLQRSSSEDDNTL